MSRGMSYATPVKIKTKLHTLINIAKHIQLISIQCNYPDRCWVSVSMTMTRAANKQPLTAPLDFEQIKAIQTCAWLAFRPPQMNKNECSLCGTLYLILYLRKPHCFILYKEFFFSFFFTLNWQMKTFWDYLPCIKVPLASKWQRMDAFLQVFVVFGGSCP